MAGVEEVYQSLGVVHSDNCNVCAGINQDQSEYIYVQRVEPIRMYYEKINWLKHPLKRYRQKRWLKGLLVTTDD